MRHSGVNEVENVRSMVEALLDLDISTLDILIVDDESPDGTGRIADELSAQRPDRVHVLHRTGQRGLGRAYIDGFRWALEHGADFIVQGEGEVTVPQFLAALEARETRGIFSHDDLPDITSSPIPRFDLLQLEDYVCVGIQTSRGCPFDCEFCDVVALYGHKPRYKTPDQVIAELDTLHKLGWKNEVFIADDNFIGNKRNIKSEVLPSVQYGIILPLKCRKF